MKNATRQKIKMILSIIAGAVFYLIFRKKQQTAAPEKNTTVEKLAEKAAAKKESEIEKTDSLELLAHSANTERNSANVTKLADGHKERVRTRIRQELQR